eukprot:CAMPEP_0118661866 /NCGR_PEP_ID=MMETSP0785-20121206/16516_1 /TAXON_ID=91992 /ORGANISM="Bolidomonas pacifica, Strain CCMP 1866" /LENGTH=991 /DNA_ID=CAMNT_0006555351 /DNA_START=61 /DNA_END=3032 /DNA_ORIENTATION=+
MCIFCGHFCSFLDASGSPGASSKYRFSRADFGPVPFRPLHYDLSIRFNEKTEDGVDVKSRQTYRNETDKPLSTLTLNAHDLTVTSVSILPSHTPLGPSPVGFDAVVPDFVAHVKELDGLTEVKTKYDYDKESRKLVVTLPNPVAPNEEVCISTSSTCYPNDTQLEGIYFDQTPLGKPQTMISQCQQYGFQRIVPCVDTMNAKTFFTTRITCLKEYSNVLCNGDKVKEEIVEGGKMQCVTYTNHVVNMAPYLFFIGVGTYDTHVGEVEYPNGDCFNVELLCLPGVVEKVEDARDAVKSLVDSIIWTQVCTGPEKYMHSESRSEILSLIKERDILKSTSSSPAKLAEIRGKLKTLISEWNETGYTYPFKVYREIAMENSNYGGMENLNNTTILSSRLTPSRWLVDGGFVYMEGVKVHEFYHNINGSQATGETPFEIWLNEAVTVHVQREREDAIFGHDYMRLGQVMYAQQPGSGPLALDRAPSSMAVEPKGFNTTHELISAMTYSKAPEFVRMTQSIIGKENFVKALFDYHKKFAFSNATSWQWVEEMARYQPDGVDLVKMAKGWLQRTGYPTLVVEKETWEGGKGKVSVKQTGFEDKDEDEKYPWIIPIKWAAVKDGKVIKDGLKILQEEKGEIEIEGVESVDFVSIACDWSFYGDVRNDAAGDEQRLAQAKSDPDTVNRFLAFQSILDDEKCKLVEALRSGVADGLVEVSDGFVDLYGKILNDDGLAVSTKGRFLAISSSCPSRPEISHLYNHLSQARTAVLQAVYKKYGETLRKVYADLNVDSCLENRTLKQAVFAAIRSGIATNPVIGGGLIDIYAGQKEAFDMIAPLLKAKDMSDRAFALKAAIELGRTDAMDDAREEWTKHTIGCEQYISCIAQVDSDASPDHIRKLITEPFFKMALAGHARTVSRAWCANQKRALLTKDGLKLTKELFWAVGKVNQMSAYGFISAFAQTMKFDGSVRDVLIKTVKEMRDGLDAKKQESLFNQLSRV